MVSRAAKVEDKQLEEIMNPEKKALITSFNDLMAEVFKVGPRFSPDQMREFEAKGEMAALERQVRGATPTKNEKQAIMPIELNTVSFAEALNLAEHLQFGDINFGEWARKKEGWTK